MKFSLPTLLGLSLFLSFVSAAQDPIAIGFEVPANLPSTKEEFVNSEPLTNCVGDGRKNSSYDY